MRHHGLASFLLRYAASAQFICRGGTADPDWSIWYAGRLLEQGIEQHLDAKLLKSDLVYLLVFADKQQNLEAPGGRWERYYADFFLSRYHV